MIALKIVSSFPTVQTMGFYKQNTRKKEQQLTVFGFDEYFRFWRLFFFKETGHIHFWWMNIRAFPISFNWRNKNSIRFQFTTRERRGTLQPVLGAFAFDQSFFSIAVSKLFPSRYV